MPITIDGSNGITQAGEFNSDSTFGFKNRIINGAMVIDQRNAGASVTPINAQYLVDRFVYAATQTGKFTAQQNAGAITPPVGFSNYLGFTSTSAYSIIAGDLFVLQQLIEGFNTSDLNWGTANAKTVTLSFQVYSSLTGTFGGSLRNNAGDRSYPFSYSVPIANTWTTISVTIAGDTTGTWIGATNGIGLRVGFSLGSGATYSGTAGAWAAANYLSATGATSVVGTSGATFYITGVQLEVGSTATSFDYRPYGTELALCQRYYEIFAFNTYSIVGQAYSTSAAKAPLRFSVEKRTAPTATLPAAGNTSGTIAFTDASMNYPATIGTHTAGEFSVSKMTITGTGYTSAFTAGIAVTLYGTGAGNNIGISAEL
jgi:hypothetical protein